MTRNPQPRKTTKRLARVLRAVALAALPLAAAAVALPGLTGCSSAPAAKQEVRKSYVFWPEAPAEPRVQFVTSYRKASDVKPEKAGGLSDLLYGKAETVADLPISKPYGIAAWDGRVYVTDLRGQGIVVLDLKKQETRLMGASGSGALKRANDVCVGPDGTKYVADMGRQAIAVFDAGERFVKAFSAPDFNPVAVAVRGDELYVCDAKAQVVKVLDRNQGTLLRTIGKPGGEDGQFIFPIDVAVDPSGNLLVVDALKARVQRFSPDGKLLGQFGKAGNRPGDFVRPKHIAVASDGTIFVVDASFNNVQVFDAEGRVMGFFGAMGAHPGAMDLPAGVAVVEGDLSPYRADIHPDFQADRLVLVSNNFGPNKVSVYAVGGLKPGRTVADINASRIEIKAAGTQDPGKPADFTTTRPVFGEGAAPAPTTPATPSPTPTPSPTVAGQGR